MEDLRKSRWFWIVMVTTTLTLTFRVSGTASYLAMGMLGLEQETGEIVGLEPGMPAERAGLQVGDRIVEADGADRRPRIGENVTYIVERNGERLRFDLEAAPVPGTTLAFLVASGVMGLAFLGIGVFVFLRTGTVPGILLASYGICQALHWGGNPDTSSAALRDAMTILILLATMLAASFLLHLALAFPPSWPVANRRRTWVWLYAPAAVALVFALVGQEVAFYLLMNLQAYLYTLAAFVVMCVRWRRADPTQRKTHGLGVMIWGFLAGVVPYLAALVISAAAPEVELPGGLGPFPYTLFFALIPAAFAFGILRAQPSSST